MDETTNGGYTSAATYPGYAAPTPVELPSGATFLLRKPQIMKMMRKGQIPNPLMEIVNDVFNERDATELAAEADAKGMTVAEVLEQRQRDEEADRAEKGPPIPETPRGPEEFLTGLAFMDVVVWASIVAPAVEMLPPVGETPLTVNGTLSYDALADEDIQHILSWANREAEEMSTFPADTGRESGSGDGREVRPEAEQPSLDPA